MNRYGSVNKTILTKRGAVYHAAPERAKPTGDVLNDDPRDLQLLPIAGRLKCAHVNHVEALCDAEDVLVWSVAVTPTIEKLSVWELDGKHGWKSLPDIHSRANNPTSRMMRFAQLSTVKAFSPN